MATTTVGNGETSNNTEVTNGNTLEVASGGTVDTTQVDSGATLLVDSGGTDNTATVEAGGTETVYGTSNGDTVYGTLNVPSSNGTAAATGVVNNLVIESGGSVNLTFKGGLVDGATVNAGGLLTINGNAAANNVTLQGGTLDLQSPKADSTNSTGVSASGTLTFASGTDSRLQLDAAQTGTNGTTFAQTISGYAAGDVIELKTLTAANPTVSTTFNNDGSATVTVGAGNTGAETFKFANTSNTATFTTQTDSNGGTDLLEAACYASGTLIRLARGGSIVDVPVEELVVGDLAVTASGAHRPIRWIGHRRVDCRHHGRPRETLPVRIAAHAFAPDRPARDLFVSPGHALCLDLLGEVLIPASALVNGATIAQVEIDTVTYWHVELDTHDILLADNLPAESFLDVGNRDFFVESEITTLDGIPDARPDGIAAHCRPFVADGVIVDVARERLATRAIALGWTLQARPFADAHLVVDGTIIRPVVSDVATESLAARFVLTGSPSEVWLVSDAGIPALVDGGADTRSLGLCLAKLTVDDGLSPRRVVAVDDSRLDDGFHIPEGRHRWTVGRARLPAALWTGCADTFFLRLDLALPALPRWVAPMLAAETPTAIAA